MTWAQVSERKFDNEIKNTPENVGPGLYDITPVLGNKRALKAPFGAKSDRILFVPPKDQVPPPGSYNVTLLDNDIKITSVFHSGTKRSFFDPQKTPDPTLYSNINQWGQVKAKKQIYKRTMPKNRPMTTFFGQKGIKGYTTNKNGDWVPIKEPESKPEDLGPGTYDPIYKVDTSIKVSLDQHAGRDIFQARSSQPGPGEYNPDIVNKRKLLPQIARTLSPSQPQSDVAEFISPAPWVDESLVGRPTSQFRSGDKRDVFQVSSSTPGPATYYRTSKLPQEYYDNSCFGVRAKRKFLDITSDTPGPGTYSIRDIPSMTNSAKIHSRLNPIKSNSMEFPGPGQYKTTKSLLGNTNRPSSVFASKVSRVSDPSTEVPGPGRYTPLITDTSRQVPIAISERTGGETWINRTQMENPDPTAYQSILPTSNGKGVTISKLDRDTKTADNTPGPGQYNVLHKTFIRKSFNSAVSKLEDDEM
ncbi:hypothetical protein TVAG_137890 [Trichomonas vaginalis G3]|uniref:Sperm-tail PG-rich repeat family protein n=1 Tax=Trichomonas vaginalis (strain ATCC PRA-98 / G3) TaxID=412133 RepID=A2EC22_TRIV3|nr:sperm-tail PG-rich domain-containing protein [Trichomonas vaginalis G3]EAY09797.1 hypothetical protein TVAG_137890 [Trichomonas vaginalis G3]KAI5525748.1 sperm-tail PG-rich domain-containing protein [Trichomonas vaginalis G3]|eukprot:XP_001322020.1 hypothetical protein [Trichomonas vaginalis G3]